MSTQPFPVENHAPVTVDDCGVIRFGGSYVCDTRAGESPASFLKALDDAWSHALTKASDAA